MAVSLKREAARVALLMGISALCLPTAALAAPKVIKPLKIYSANEFYGVQSAVSGRDEAVVVISLPSDSSDSNLAVVARTRNAAGSFGPVQELSRSANVAGMGFRGPIRFAPNGSTAISLIGGSSTGLYSFRKAGGQFSAPISITNPGDLPCFNPAGVFDTSSKLLIVCPTEATGSTLGHVTVANPLAPVGSLSVLSQFPAANTEPDFGAATGPGGTRAIVWSVDSGPNNTAIRTIVDPGTGIFGTTELVGSIVSLPAFPYGRFNDVVVLGDGSTAISWEVVGAQTPSPQHVMKLRVRSPGQAGTYGAEETIQPSVDSMKVEADGAAGAALIGWRQERQSESDPSYIQVASRPKGGPIGPSVKLAGSDHIPPSGNDGEWSMSVGPDGTAQVTSCRYEGIKTWVRRANAASRTAFTGPFTVANRSGGIVSCQASVDRRGNVLVTWGTDDSGPDGVFVGGIDAGGTPSLRFSAAPSRVVAGVATTLSASAGDPSGIDSIRWDFGDRSRAATGSSVKHSWRRPGTYRVKVKATDRAGRSTVRSVRVKVVRG